MSDKPAKLRFAGELHSYVREHISQADQKATFFFAAASALLAFLYDAQLLDLWVKSFSQWSVLDVLSLVALVALTSAVGAFLLTVYPRLGGSNKGLIYFSAVAAWESRATYQQEFEQQEMDDLMRETAEHIYDLATICKRKYAILRVGLWLGLVGLVATLMLWVAS